MLLPYTQQVHDSRGLDYQLAQMINEPHTDMKADLDLHDEENKVQYDREALRKAKFVSGPHFWNDSDGTPYVTVMFDVRTQYVNRGHKERRGIITA